MEASFDWVRFVIDKPMAHAPGTTFNYNSGASQILSHIFRRHTGRDLEEYGRQYLFRILGIERHYWKRTPTGLPDTEGGLYLRSRDLAKIAYLYMNGGTWDGNLVIPSSWVESSLAPQVTVESRPRYGFKWWLYPYGTNRVAWGGAGFGDHARSTRRKVKASI
jgi:CubicO group peptidase (beta-lactamase class C family)